MLSHTQKLVNTFFIFFIVISFTQVFGQTMNGEGGIWTLAPLLTTYSLSRGAPSATWVLLQGLTSWILSWWTERVGFEPTRPCGQTVFKTASLWPLRYLSITYSVVVVLCVSRDDLFIIPNQNTYVNTFFKVFLFFLFFLSKSLFIGLHL